MKTLKGILWALYPILIILLLLMGLKGCSCDRNDGAAPPAPQPPTENPAPPTQAPAEEPAPENAADENQIRQAEQTGNNGALKVTLLWDFQGDIDLHVIEPNRNEIYFENKIDGATGGALDVDNKSGGPGSAENIYWQNPPNGNYNVFLHYYGPSESTHVAQAGTCTVIVFQQGKEPLQYKVNMATLKEKKPIVNITVD